jgi:hypothetical protein
LSSWVRESISHWIGFWIHGIKRGI